MDNGLCSLWIMRLNLIPVCSCIVEYNNTGGLFSIDKKIQNISIVSNDFSSQWNSFFLFKFHFQLVFHVVNSFLFYCFFLQDPAMSSSLPLSSYFRVRTWDCDRIHGPIFSSNHLNIFTNCSRGSLSWLPIYLFVRVSHFLAPVYFQTVSRT